MPTRTARLTVVSAAATAVVAATVGATAAPQVPTRAPTLKATIQNGKLAVVGSKTFPAGRLNVSLTAVDKESEIAVVTLHKGYTFQNLRHDIAAFGASFDQNGQPSQSGLRHLRHVFANVTAYGGLDVPKGKTLAATLLIPRRAGETVIFNDSGNLPAQKKDLTVTAASGPQTLPATGDRVVAMTDKRFGGDTTLPAKGKITFRNISTESPHLLVMQHVQEGTTRKQVIASLTANTPPAFVRPGSEGTDFLSEGQAQTLQTKLPAGEYALMCFVPDPQTGVPHALMGMVRMVHLT
jgi:hypothetical protein